MVLMLHDHVKHGLTIPDVGRLNHFQFLVEAGYDFFLKCVRFLIIGSNQVYLLVIVRPTFHIAKLNVLW